MEKPLRILQVSGYDSLGGAGKVAWELHRGYQAQGCSSWMAVGYKGTQDPHVLTMDSNACRNGWARGWLRAGDLLSPLVGRVQGAEQMRKFVRSIGQPRRLWEVWRGHEDFDFPATWRLLDLIPERPDIVHGHNLHGGYFDLRALPWLSRQVPLVLTLHDAWLLSGHCAHSLDCERWKTGCGDCPDLTIYPAIRQDATAFNWRRKQEVYSKSRIYVTTPSHWLMQKVEQSMLAPAVLGSRVIPNGVDLSRFHPADRQAARRTLGISQGVRVLLFTTDGLRHNVWKDYQTLRAAMALLAERSRGQRVFLLALGEEAPAERKGQTEIRFVPYQKDPLVVARYYQAADIYVHAARVDTFPNAILEALACGTPVIATAVGGIPEQVKGLQMTDYRFQAAGDGLNKYGPNEATGVLLPAKDEEAMFIGISRLLNDEPLRSRLAENACRDARERFCLKRQVRDYLGWYHTILRERSSL